MKHEYTDTELQSAIDEACLETHREHRGRVGSNLVIDTDAMPSVYAAEASARLDLIKSALAALPEPEPLTVDGKTPGQVAWDAGNEVQKRKFPNEPVMSWQEGDELHEQIGVAAAAVRAAFGNQSQAVEEANARAEKAEAELAVKTEQWETQRISLEQLFQKLNAMDDGPQLSQLRPLAEAGPVPEGCVRVTGYKSQHSKTGWVVTDFTYHGDTHFADIMLPEAKAPAVEAEKPDPYAELKKAHAAGKVIQINCCTVEQPHWVELPSPAFFGKPHEYRIKPEPSTFEAHGKTWTRHTPGDAMPCDGEAIIRCLFADRDVWNADVQAKSVRWAKINCNGDIIGWRYADEPTPEPMLTKPISLPLAECMSLRDWFAGQALEGMLSNPESISNKTSVAIHAYGFADAMLAAREVAP